MISQSQKVQLLFAELCKQPLQQFPRSREQLEAPLEPGVYVIHKGKKVLHVGRTHRAKGGIYKRLKDHLYGSSSFTDKYLKGNGATLRKKGYTYQFVIVKDAKTRAFLEAYAIGMLCPEHIGLGE